MTLTEFILERIAEDEEAARAASTITVRDGDGWRDVPGEPAVWVTTRGGEAVERTNGSDREPGMVVYDEGNPTEEEAAHIARHDPARVLAECTALQAVVELHQGSPSCESCYDFAPMDAPCPTLRALASIWADHENYDPAWRLG